MSQPFWNFSLAVYGASAVQDECLSLQDQFGLDVNLVLFCAFVGAVHGVALTCGDVAAARQEVAQWHDDIVRPLRAARRNLKTIVVGDADAAKSAAQLRTQVKAAELESEQIEQTILEQWANARLAAWPRVKTGDAVLANLRTLLAAYDIAPERLDVANAMYHIIAAARQSAA